MLTETAAPDLSPHWAAAHEARELRPLEQRVSTPRRLLLGPRWRRSGAIATSLVLHLGLLLWLSTRGSEPAPQRERVPLPQELIYSFEPRVQAAAPPAKPEAIAKPAPAEPPRPATRPQPLPPPAEPQPLRVVSEPDTRPAAEHLTAPSTPEPPVEHFAESAPTPATRADLAPARPTPAPETPVTHREPSRELSPAELRRARQAQSSWTRVVLARLAAQRFYPPEARKDKAEGTVQLRFTLQADGRVLDASVLGWSGHPALAEAALAVLERAAPLPPIPPEMHRARLTLTVPIAFDLTTD